jgi:hypothetical protein
MAAPMAAPERARHWARAAPMAFIPLKSEINGERGVC